MYSLKKSKLLFIVHFPIVNTASVEVTLNILCIFKKIHLSFIDHFFFFLITASVIVNVEHTYYFEEN